LTLKKRAWLLLKRTIEGSERQALEPWIPYLISLLSPREWRMLTSAYDDANPLPAGASIELVRNNPRLLKLNRSYGNLNLPVNSRSAWNETRMEAALNLSYFRGQNAYIWQYFDWPRTMVLKYYLLAQYVRSRDPQGLLEQLGEDGAFGCWTYSYPGFPPISRDLLDSVNEIMFLDRHLGILNRPGLRVLDIGAGFGRLAYRMSQALPDLADYCCVDAIAESTFLCEYYTRYRNCPQAVRVVPLHELDSELGGAQFDLAVNIHSFSECTYEAVAWWAQHLERLRPPNLLIIPNEPTELLTTEVSVSKENKVAKRDFRPLIEAAGYELKICEPVYDNPATRELANVHDHFFLFTLKN
jgi:hypothetical protein